MYPIIDVTAEAGHLEPMGSKPKFWFEHAEWGVCLFKAARPRSGEDWSEKLAEQFAQALGVPHARYELAVCKGDRGIVTPRLTTEAQDLVHGNEILIDLDDSYAEGSLGYRTPLHTVEAVMSALANREVGPPIGWTLPDGVTTARDVLAGYLLLDSLIGNTDRHHENWAAIKHPANGDGSMTLSLCPSFDHASSLGRNEPVERMVARLETSDVGFTVEAYARRARSALYSDPEDARPLTPIDAFRIAVSLVPAGAAAWCARLHSVDGTAVREIVGKVPEERMPDAAKKFVVRMVELNRLQLVELCLSL